MRLGDFVSHLYLTVERRILELSPSLYVALLVLILVTPAYVIIAIDLLRITLNRFTFFWMAIDYFVIIVLLLSVIRKKRQVSWLIGIYLLLITSDLIRTFAWWDVERVGRGEIDDLYGVLTIYFLFLPMCSLIFWQMRKHWDRLGSGFGKFLKAVIWTHVVLKLLPEEGEGKLITLPYSIMFEIIQIERFMIFVMVSIAVYSIANHKQENKQITAHNR